MSDEQVRRIQEVVSLAIELIEHQPGIRVGSVSHFRRAAKELQQPLAIYAADYEARQRSAWLDRLCVTGQFERTDR
jgi:hypothetical protein